MYKIEQQNEKRLDCLIEIEKHIPLSEDFSLAEYHLMQECSNDEDETVRSMVARLLIDANSTEGEDILCRLAFDSSQHKKRPHKREDAVSAALTRHLL